MNQNKLENKTIEKIQKNNPKVKLSGGIVAALLTFCFVVSLFYGASFYKSETEKSVNSTNARSKQFEVVFNELLKARFRAMGIAADTLLQSKVTMEPFAKGDREALGARVDPYFALLQKRHGVDQLNFWLPKATMFYRAGSPELAQFDGSKFRRSILAATERRDRIMTVETGQGGVVGIRAIVPVTWDGEFKGVVEYVSSFRIPLEGAAQDSQLNWAMGVSQERLLQVERPKNDATDISMGEDVFYEYSDKTTQENLKKLKFDSRGKDFQIVENQGQVFFIKAIPVFNFSGVATITIAMVDDITQEYSAAMMKSIARSLAVFVILAAILLFAYFKIDHFRAGIMGSVGAEKRLLQERLAQGDAALKKLADMDLIKRQSLYSLMSAVNKPLIAINGQISAFMKSVLATHQELGKDSQLQAMFIENESNRLQAYVADFLQVEQMRQGFVDMEREKLSIQGIIEQAILQEDLKKRYPLLKLNVNWPADLPKIQANPGLLEKAFINLLRYSVTVFGQDTLMISGSVDVQGAIAVTITGNLPAKEIANDFSVLNEFSVFSNELSTGVAPGAGTEKLMGIFLSKLIIEYYGGKLVETSSSEAGFIVHLNGVF
jgi:signal transduction histidine kinase